MEENNKKLLAISEIANGKGGFFLVTYDEDGFCNLIECIGDNKAAYKASKLNDLIANAQMEYINWRSAQENAE